MYSDMPIKEMAASPEFIQKWMLGIVGILNKGLHLNIIHDINRNFVEMLIGLEINIPMYMTGNISPYYLTSSQSNLFHHVIRISGAAAIEGSSVVGQHTNGKYSLFRSQTEINHYTKHAKALLAKAAPLMDIYKQPQHAEFRRFLSENILTENLKIICNSLPVYTMSDESLKIILDKSTIDNEKKHHIYNSIYDYKTIISSFLSEHSIHLILPQLSMDQMSDIPISLALSDLFLEDNLFYSKEDYEKHLDETLQFAQNHKNLTIEFYDNPMFNNITITVVGDKSVIVSKEKSPNIHFVIHHPNMVSAFKNFTPINKNKG